jgi:plastocyanin
VPFLRYLPLVLPLAAACGYSAPTAANAPPSSPPAAAGDIDIVSGASVLTLTAFAPNPKTVALGSGGSVAVRWLNQDVGGGGGVYGTVATSHNITSDEGAFAPSGVLAGGASYTVTFSMPGTYRFHCSIHPNMVGSVVVTK